MVKRLNRKLLHVCVCVCVFFFFFSFVYTEFVSYRYKNDPEILAMTNLIAAYQKNEILEFEKILKVGILCIFL